MVTPDSKFPNLAMMKLYAYHKAKGDDISFNINNPDLSYVSVLFSKNKWMVKNIPSLYPGAEIIAGGPGYDPAVKLPAEIEKTPPCQELYPNSKYAIGRVTSGCIRKCSFCVVPKLEPAGPRYIMHPREIYREGKILRLLDDNILSLKGAWQDVFDFCYEKKCVLRMEYFDARLITGQIAAQIAALRHEYAEVWISWDMTKDEKLIVRGIERLVNAGKKPYRVRCLLYVHDENCIPDAKYRFTVLRELGVLPFIMFDRNAYTFRNKRKLRWIVKYGSRPANIKSMTVDEVFR